MALYAASQRWVWRPADVGQRWCRSAVGGGRPVDLRSRSPHGSSAATTVGAPAERKRQRVDALGVCWLRRDGRRLSGIAEGGHWGWRAPAQSRLHGGSGRGGVVRAALPKPSDRFCRSTCFGAAFRSRRAQRCSGVARIVALANVLFLPRYGLLDRAAVSHVTVAHRRRVGCAVGRGSAPLGERTIGVPGALILASAGVWFRSTSTSSRTLDRLVPRRGMAGSASNGVPMLQWRGAGGGFSRDVGVARSRTQCVDLVHSGAPTERLSGRGLMSIFSVTRSTTHERVRAPGSYLDLR